MPEFATHIKMALFDKRNEIIFELDKNGFKLPEIQFIMSQPISTQRIYQIIIKQRAKLQSPEGEK